jgi:hypothetical protein
MTESEINALIETKLEPLRAEIRVLQEKLGLSTPEPVVSEVPVVSSVPEIPESLEPMPQIPPERADFQKFLQRGLEQEQREYTEENLEAKPAPKKGWNPFKR